MHDVLRGNSAYCNATTISAGRLKNPDCPQTATCQFLAMKIQRLAPHLLLRSLDSPIELAVLEGNAPASLENLHRGGPSPSHRWQDEMTDYQKAG